MTIIIGVCGFAGSGKDTVGDRLVAANGFRKYALATPLKEYVKEVFDFTDEQLYGTSSKREEEDPRYLFSGTCPRCGRRCKEIISESKWSCDSCAEVYPRFLTARLALQTLGTEWGRRLYDNVWIDYAARRMKAAPHGKWVVTDVRFSNEVKTLRAQGARIIRLMRGGQRFSHASESEMSVIPLDWFDYIIDNREMTLDQLYERVDAIAEGMGA